MSWELTFTYRLSDILCTHSVTYNLFCTYRFFSNHQPPRHHRLGPANHAPTLRPQLAQIARAKAIKSHYLETQAHSGADARKQAEIASKGVIVSLGLIKPEGDTAGGGSDSDSQ
jgi:hypothetical protein